MEIEVDIDNICNYIHSKLIIRTDEDEYEGMLKFVNKSNQSVTFEHTYELPSREYLGTVHFAVSGIETLILSESPKNFERSNFDSANKAFASEFDKKLRINTSEIIIIPSDKHFTDYLPEHLKENCPNDFSIIDSVDNCFYKAVTHLSKSTVIGVSCHGPKISRSGTITWICLSTSRIVFLFDIQKLSKAAFLEGLKKILEDEKIEKVIHDCREVADCLRKLYDTNLNGLYDTQGADYVINMQMCKGKKIFRYVNSLDSCLTKYLKVPQQFLYNHNKSTCIDDEVEFYEQRPLSKDFLNFMLKSTMYLIYLKEEQEKLLMSPLEQAIELHLNSARSASDFKVLKMLAEESAGRPPSHLLESVKPIRFEEMPKEEDLIKKMTPEERKEWYLKVTGVDYCRPGKKIHVINPTTW